MEAHLSSRRFIRSNLRDHLMGELRAMMKLGLARELAYIRGWDRRPTLSYINLALSAGVFSRPRPVNHQIVLNSPRFVRFHTQRAHSDMSSTASNSFPTV